MDTHLEDAQHRQLSKIIYVHELVDASVEALFDAVLEGEFQDGLPQHDLVAVSEARLLNGVAVDQRAIEGV